MAVVLKHNAILRLALASDEPAVLALLTQARLPLDGVHEALPCFIVAEHAGDIVGVAGIEACGVSGEHALLRSVAVASSWQSRGLGRSLVMRTIAEAERRGVKALYLLTTTAEEYFPTFGFEITARDTVPEDIQATGEYCHACPASATVMVRTSARDSAPILPADEVM
ncbi:MAG: GCN5-related N-acetyltransferase [Gemmatimonadetes bacterium]|nr:GCN5-related N-acetyltransferase [Gemmatimonadota bacterium]